MSHLRRLPDAELEVMQAIWACEPPVSRHQIEAMLQNTHPMAMTTLLTLLTRLADRGFVTMEKIGRGNCYTLTVSREDYLAAQSGQFFKQVCGGSMSAFASALCHSGLTKEELSELRDLLERDAL